MYRLFVLCSLAFVSGTVEVALDDVEFSSYISGDAVSSAVGRASRWLLHQRDETTGWGSFTPRAMAALALSAHHPPLPEWERFTKQLNVHLAMQLRNDASSSFGRVSRLSLSVVSLLASCQDPRLFHSRDLVRLLRVEAKHHPMAAAFLSLCLAGDATHADLTRLASMYQDSYNRTDLQALQLLGMSCMTDLPWLASARPTFISYLHEFASRFQASLRSNSTDVYTKALAMQALFSGGMDVVPPSSLLSDQQPDGSFERSLLATYHAIPALMATSLLAIRDIQCPNRTTDRAEFPPSQSSSKVVQVSVWVGEGVERDTHSITVAMGANDTLLDVLRAAENRNPTFRFSSDSSASGGVRLYSLSGIPNDAEREISWRLYSVKSGRRKEVLAGLDQVFPLPNDHFVFWFQRNSSPR